MRNTNIIREAAIFMPWLWKRLPKNSGMVAEERCLLMTLVRRPRMTQASRLPIRALPMPIQVEARPYFHPN